MSVRVQRWDWEGWCECSVSICQWISKVIALTSVSRGIWIWRRAVGNLYMHTHTHTHRAIRLICVTLNNLKLHLRPSCVLAHIRLSFMAAWVWEKTLRLLYFSYYGVQTRNHDYLSQLQETTADCFFLQINIRFHLYLFQCSISQSCREVFFFLHPQS